MAAHSASHASSGEARGTARNTTTSTRVDMSALGNSNWEIDILGKRAKPRRGYLASRLDQRRRVGMKALGAKNSSRGGELGGSMSLPSLIPGGGAHLLQQSSSEVALRTTLDLLAAEDLMPSPKIVRTLKQRFVGAALKRRPSNNRLERLSQKNLEYATILHSVARLKGINRDLKSTQENLELLLIPQNVEDVDTAAAAGVDCRSSFLTQAIPEDGNVEFHEKEVHEKEDSGPAPGTWDWQLLQKAEKKKRDQKNVADMKKAAAKNRHVEEGDEDVVGLAAASAEAHQLHWRRPQRRHQVLLENRLRKSGFSDLISKDSPPTLPRDDDAAKSKYPPTLVEDAGGSLISVPALAMHKHSSSYSTVTASSSSSSSFAASLSSKSVMHNTNTTHRDASTTLAKSRSLLGSSSFGHATSGGTSFALLTRRALDLKDDLKAAKGLLASHLGSELLESYNRDVARQRAWLTLVKGNQAFRVILSTWKSKRLKRLLLLGRSRFAVKIQNSWRTFLEYRFQEKLELNKRNAHMMRMLAFMVRCKWRTRTAARVRSFCTDYVDDTSRFGIAIRVYRWRIARVQRMIASFFACKSARIVAMRRRWHACENKLSWNVASGVRSCFYYLARTREKEGALYRQRQLDAEDRLESERAKKRPKLRLSLFRVGKPPREAMFQLRVYQNKLPLKKLEALQTRVSEYKERKDFLLLAQRYNSSLNRIVRLTDTLSEFDDGEGDKNTNNLAEATSGGDDGDDEVAVRPSRLQRRLSLSVISDAQLTSLSAVSVEDGIKRRGRGRGGEDRGGVGSGGGGEGRGVESPLAKQRHEQKNLRASRTTKFVQKRRGSQDERKQVVLQKIKKWRQREIAPKINMSASMQRRMRARKKAARAKKKPNGIDYGESSESTSDYGARKIPKEVVTVVLTFAIEQVRRIHHVYCKNKNVDDKKDAWGGIDDDEDSDNSHPEITAHGYGYHDDDGGGKHADAAAAAASGGISVSGLRSALRRGTVALNDFTIHHLQAKFKQDEAAKFPVFRLATTMNLERMQALMVLAGSSAASLSLLNAPAAAASFSKRDLSIMVMAKLRDLLNMFPGNFLQQLDNFKPENVHAWADKED